MKAVLINPNLVVQRNDPFTTGIVYLPVGLAYVAAAFQTAEIPVAVVDAFGLKPRSARREGKFFIFGLTPAELVRQLPSDAGIIFIYANQLLNHCSIIHIIRAVKSALPGVPLAILENTQAVTAYALSQVAPEFFAAGADYVLTGEAEQTAIELARAVMTNGEPNNDNMSAIQGLLSPRMMAQSAPPQSDPDLLPFPAWDLFPLSNYWGLRFSHGPLSARRYLPLLTSRGCPFACRFCIVPATNQQKWRARRAKNVVDEIEYFKKKWQVSEFHIEDLNPTVSDERIREFCRELVNRDLKVTWKIASGTKIETIRDEETLALMAQSGCRYISVSPETGSPSLLKQMNKTFDQSHADNLLKAMNRLGIRSQACFVLGFPGETDQDREETARLVRRLTREGLDEIALFIVSPAPGSAIYQNFSGYASLSELNFTPTWRPDYRALNLFRRRLYLAFLFWKLTGHPLKILRQVVNFLRRHFETKMEMVPYRAMVLTWWARNAHQNHENRTH